MERLEPRLTETRRERTFWELALKLQHELGLKERFEETVLRAAKLSVSPACMRLAKPLCQKRRLADAAPGAMTPGLLANELRIRFVELGYGAQASKFKKILAAKDLGRARAALSGEGQTAYDLAVLALLSRMEQGDLVLRCATDALAAAPADGK